MANVKFYKLNALPSFNQNAHVGIFVHATGTTAITTGTDGNAGYLMATGKTFAEWAEENHYDEIIPSGLWFGGANGWELLTNDTSSGAINAAIAALDVNGYAQAEITNVASSNISTLSIKGIKEVDGKIEIDGTKNLDIKIDGDYNKDTNKIATQSTVTNAIKDLDVDTINTVEQTSVTGGTQLTFKGVKEVDGKIAQGDSTNNSFTVTVGDGKLSIGGTEVFSANTTTNKNITLGSGLTFDGSELGLVLSNGIEVTTSNPLVTKSEIDSLAGAMEYKGTVSSADDLTRFLGSSENEAGDVYIANASFTHDGNPIEIGDMIVIGGNDTYTVIQSNISLGNQNGQVAANVGNLENGKLVIATGNGIGTTAYNLEGASSRTISAVDYTTDGAVPVCGGVVTDTFTVLGQERIASLKIGSVNNSIVVNASNDGNEATFTVDLIWKETI